MKNHYRNELIKFLDERSANNNQMVLAFIYMFMRRVKATKEQFLAFQGEINTYLDKRITESSHYA